jgi:polysaccharide biosynthesis/export protein
MARFAQILMWYSKNSFMGKIARIVGIGLVFFASAACVSNEKIIYLQNLEGKQVIPEDELISYDIPEYKLQYNDIVDVNIQTVDDLLLNGFNNKSVAGNQQMQMAGQTGGDIYYMTGYTVDRNGFIRIPIVGEVQVQNKSLDEVRVQIESQLKEYVKTEVYVKVKLGGIRYSALGEFKRPGKFVVLQDRMTIFEAIANAGDLTNISKRDEILLIRQYPEGTKLHRLNLNDRQLIRSPYYFIQPNDQLYAEPMKVREVGAGENAAQSLALIISAITAAVLIINVATR